MAWKPKKKPKPLSYAEQQFVKNLIESTKAKCKTMRGYAILKRDGAQADYKMSGVFKDIDELKQCADNFAQDLSKKSGKKWRVLEVMQNGVETGEEDNEVNNDA